MDEHLKMCEVYICKHECGYNPKTRLCLSYQLRKLAEEVAEVQQAMFQDQLYVHPNLATIKEWKDVRMMVSGIETYHPWILGVTHKQRGDEL